MRERSDKLQRLLDVVAVGDYLVLDSETTGLDAASEVVQLAIVDAQGNVLLDTLIKPFYSIPAAATAIHGITDDMVADAPTWVELTEQVQALLTGRDVIVYNAVFDRKMLHHSAEFWSLPAVAWKELARFHCAMLTFAEVYGVWNPRFGDWRWQSLGTAANSYGIEANASHSALGDCRTTLAVVQKMAEPHGRAGE